MNEDKITVDDLDGEQREIAECIGLESYLKLAEYFGGTSVYIQKADKMIKLSRDEKIRAMFDGGNYKAIARKFNLSESAVRKIVNGSSSV